MSALSQKINIINKKIKNIDSILETHEKKNTEHRLQ